MLDTETILSPELPIPAAVIRELKAEAGILEDFARLLEDRRPCLVTFQGRGFDLPVVATRCLRHGIPFRHYYRWRDVRYRSGPRGTWA